MEMTSSYIFLNSIPAFARVNQADNVFMLGHSRADFMRRHGSQADHSHIMLFEVTSEKLNDALDGLPENHVHCTVLAVNTLRKTIEKLIDRDK